jgi:photosystem II stability/assembly factor-like uncharacterized protein
MIALRDAASLRTEIARMKVRLSTIKRGPQACLTGILFSLILIAGPKPARMPLKWEVIGPGGGGALFAPAISPVDPNRVLVACDMTGSYLSTNGGQSWRNFNLRGRVHWFVLDPKNVDVIYALSIGLWRSTDAGRTWKLLFPDPGSVSGVVMSDDHAGESLITTTPTNTVTALAIDPADSKSLFAVFHSQNSDEVSLSTDWGKTWKPIGSLAGVATAIFIDPHSPVRNRTLYVAGKNSVSIREHGNWRRKAAPSGADTFTGIAVGFPETGGAAVVYVLSNSGIFVSEDGGDNWRRSELPGSGAEVRAIVASPNYPNIAYASYGKLKQGKTFFGVARTGDAGRSWELVWKEADKAAENVHDAWITRFFGPGYAENPLAFAIAAGDAKVVYATDYGRILRTTDGGKNWEEIYSTANADGAFAGRGLEATTSYGVHFDPFNSNRILISYTDIGLFRSEDAGHSWVAATDGVPHSWRNTTYWMVFDPEVRGRAWAVMSKTHDLPRAKMWDRKGTDNYDGGVMISEDGGRSWRKSSDGLPSTAPTHILLDPTSSAKARTLYVTAFGRGVYKSVDGGTTWSLKNNGISEPYPLAWRLARASSGELYLVVVRRSEDGSYGNQNDGALYHSRDGGEHWIKLALPPGVNGPNGLAIDPHDPARLYLSTWGRNTPPRSQGGGIYLSSDAGKTWRNVLSRDQHVYDVTMDPSDARILYAAGFESSAWRSRDRGVNWERIPGFNFKWAHRVIPDPVDPQKIYITTFGGGVWHGPATGDASSVDEIATPALAHGR